eukprot:6185645-Pleurochrysis_carterae.AAC.1
MKTDFCRALQNASERWLGTITDGCRSRQDAAECWHRLETNADDHFLQTGEEDPKEANEVATKWTSEGEKGRARIRASAIGAAHSVVATRWAKASADSSWRARSVGKMRRCQQWTGCAAAVDRLRGG